MATPSELIKQSLLLVGQIDASETLTGDQAADGLDTLNQLLHGWDIAGIHIQHTDLGLSDTIPLPPDHLRAIKYNLAVELATEYGIDPPARVDMIAQQSKQALTRLYSRPPRMRTPDHWHPYWNPNEQQGES